MADPLFVSMAAVQVTPVYVKAAIMGSIATQVSSHTQMHTYTFTHMYTPTHTHMHTHARTHTHTRSHTHTHTHTHTCTCTHAHARTHAHTHTHTHTHIHMHKHTDRGTFIILAYMSQIIWNNIPPSRIPSKYWYPLCRTLLVDVVQLYTYMCTELSILQCVKPFSSAPTTYTHSHPHQ